MGKLLERFAIAELASQLDLPGDLVQVVKSKRRKLWDAICTTRPNQREEFCCGTEAEKWEQFKRNVPGFPDGLLIDQENERAYFLEIEDSNPLTEDRLTQYANAWWALDDLYWTLHLIVANRYGHNHHEIDLRRWWFFVSHPNHENIAAMSQYGAEYLRGMNAR